MMDTKTIAENQPFTTGALSLKERQRQERVELILQTAEAVLADKSYHEMSMDEIAARVGIAKGTIYLHFPSKEDLFVALFKRTMLEFMNEIKQITARDLPARTRLELILTYSYSEQRKKQSQIFISVFSGGQLKKETLARQFSMHEYFKELAGNISRILEEGKTAGEFDTSIPTLVMLTAFLAILNRPHYEELLGENLLPAAELANQVSRVYFHGISGK